MERHARAENAEAVTGLPAQQRDVLNQPQQPTDEVGDQAFQPNGTVAAETEDAFLSENARRRFAELSNRLREREHDLEREREERDRQGSELRTLKEQLDALRGEHEQFISQSLEGLDPETRATVLMDARIRKLLSEQEQRLEAKFTPKIQGLQKRSVEADMLSLAQKYPGFDIVLHGPLVEMFRAKNPACSVEQAFLATSEPEERQPRSMRAHVPPVVEPGSGPNAVRNVPQPERDPDERLVQDRDKAAELMRSRDPKDHRDGMRMFEKNIRERYAGRFGS